MSSEPKEEPLPTLETLTESNAKKTVMKAVIQQMSAVINEILEKESFSDNEEYFSGEMFEMYKYIIDKGNSSNEKNIKMLKDFNVSLIKLLFNDNFEKYAKNYIDYALDEEITEFEVRKNNEITENDIDSLLFSSKYENVTTEETLASISSICSSFFYSSVLNIIEENPPNLEKIKKLTEFSKRIAPYLTSDYETSMFMYIANKIVALLETDSIDKDSLMYSVKFLSFISPALHGMTDKIITVAADCYYKLKDTLTEKGVFLTYVSSIMDNGLMITAGETMKNLLLDCLISETNQTIICSIYFALTDVAKTVEFTLEDSDVLLSHSRTCSDACANAIICIYSQYRDSLGYIALRLLSYNVITPELHIFIIENINDNMYSKYLFQQLARQETIDQLPMHLPDLFVSLFRDELNSRHRELEYEELGRIMLRISKPEVAVSYIDRLFRERYLSDEVLNLLKEIPKRFSKSELEKIVVGFFESIVECFLSPDKNIEFSQRMINTFCEWLSEVNSFPDSQMLQKLTQIDFSKNHFCLPQVIQSVSERTYNKRSMRLLIQKILKDTVPPDTSKWFMGCIINWIKDDKRDGEKISEGLVSSLSDSDTLSNAIHMAISIAEIEANYYRIGEEFGFRQKIIVTYEGQDVEGTVSLHQYHNTSRFYAEIENMLNLPPNSIQLEITDEEGKNKILLEEDMPLTSMPISMDVPIRFLATSFRHRDSAKRSATVLEIMACSEVSDILFNQLAHDTVYTQQIFQTLELFSKVDYPVTQPSEIQSVFLKRFHLSFDLADSYRVFPYVLKNAVESHQRLSPEHTEQALHILLTHQFDKVGLAIAVKALVDLSNPIVFNTQLLKDCLISTKHSLIREATAKLISDKTPVESFLSLIPFTLLPENRNNTKEFYELSIIDQIKTSVFDSYFSDLVQYEVSPRSKVDETFIQLIKRISKSEENLKNVFNMLVTPPTCKNCNAPFIHTSRSLKAATDFLANFDYYEMIKSMADKADMDSLETLTDDLTFIPHSVITDITESSPLSAILHILIGITPFSAAVLNLNNRDISPLMKDFRRFVAKYRFDRSGSVSFSDLMKYDKISSVQNRLTPSALTSLLTHLDFEIGGSSFINSMFESHVIDENIKDKRIQQALKSKYCLELETNGFSTLQESLDSFMETHSIIHWPRVLAISLNRANGNEKNVSKLAFPSYIMKQDGSDSVYTLCGVVVHLGSSLHSGTYKALSAGENGQWFACDTDQVMCYDINDLPNWSFGVSNTSDASSNSVYTAVMVIYASSMSKQAIEINAPHDLEEEIDISSSKAWPSRICGCDQFASLVLKQFHGEKERRKFFLSVFFPIGVFTEDVDKWCELIRENIFGDDNGIDLFFEELYNCNFAEVVEESKASAEHLIKLACSALRTSSKQNKYFKQVLDMFELSNDVDTYNLLCSFILEFVGIVDITSDIILFAQIAKAIIKNWSASIIMQSSMIRQTIEEMTKGVLTLIENEDGEEESFQFAEVLLTETFLTTFADVVSSSDVFNAFIDKIAETNPIMMENVEMYLPYRKESIERANAEKMAENETLPLEEINKTLSEILFSENEEARGIAYEATLLLLDKPKQNITSYLRNAYIREGWEEEKPVFNDLLSYHLIFAFIPYALELVEDNPSRVTEFLNILGEIAARSPQATANHLNEIIKFFPFVDEETSNKLFITVVYSLIADDSFIDECTSLLEMDGGSREAIQLVIMMQEKASNTQLSAACVDFCFESEYSDATEALVRAINDGQLVPKIGKIPEPSNNFTQLRLAIAISRVLDSKTKKKLESSMIKPMIKLAKKDPLFSQSSTVLNYK